MQDYLLYGLHNRFRKNILRVFFLIKRIIYNIYNKWYTNYIDYNNKREWSVSND